MWIFEQQLSACSFFAALGLGHTSLCPAQRQDGDWWVSVVLRGSSSPLLLPYFASTLGKKNSVRLTSHDSLRIPVEINGQGYRVEVFGLSKSSRPVLPAGPGTAVLCLSGPYEFPRHTEGQWVGTARILVLSIAPWWVLCHRIHVLWMSRYGKLSCGQSSPPCAKTGHVGGGGRTDQGLLNVLLSNP